MTISDNGVMFGQDGKIFSMEYSIHNDRLERITFFTHGYGWEPECWFFFSDKTYRVVRGVCEEVQPRTEKAA